MSVDDNLRGSRISHAATLATKVAGEGLFLHPAMNARLFDGLESRDLGVRQRRFEAAFGEGPASAAGSDQQEFDATAADPIADGSYLFTSPQVATSYRTEELD